MDKNNIKASTTPVSLTEHLSAVFDDEAGSFEQRRVLDELKSGDGLSQKLSSYALIGEVMRTSESTVTANPSFLAGINAQIESDDEYNQVHLDLEGVANDSANTKQKNAMSWLRPVGGFALAASVAAVAVIGFQNFQMSNLNGTHAGLTTASSDNHIGNDLSREKMAAATLVSTSNGATSSRQYQPANAQARQYLKSFVDSHMQYASNTAFVPTVRAIAYAN